MSRFLGRGSRKSVNSARVFGCKSVAVMTPLSGESEFFKELAVLTIAIGMKHVVQLLWGNERTLVCECAAFGSVLDYADTLEFSGKCLSVEDVNAIMRQVEQAVAELATVGLAHNDLHARNVLVFSNRKGIVAKLGDLGECAPGVTRAKELHTLRVELMALTGASSDNSA